MTTKKSRRASAAPANKLYIFDFDGNIVYTDNYILTACGRRVSACEFATGDYKTGARSFDDFQRLEITTTPGPSFGAFRRAVEDGSPIGIVTARDHPPEIFKEFILKRMMTAHGLATDTCNRVVVHTVNSKEFQEEFKIPSGMSTGERKKIAIVDIVERSPGRVAVGFSDDDPKNLGPVREVFDKFENLKCRIFDTSINHRKRV